RRHTRFSRDWSSDVCSSDLPSPPFATERISSSGTKDRANSVFFVMVFLLLGVRGRLLGLRGQPGVGADGVELVLVAAGLGLQMKIGRASCRERAKKWAAAGS